MPDWKALVLERMESLGLSRALEEEIVSELAGHLEDCYEELRTQGVCESEAFERSLEQVTDWPNLSRKIRRAKRKGDVMNHRTRTLWLPVLVTLAAAMVFLMISTQIALQPRIIAGRFVTLHTSTTSTDYPFAAYLPWLILLPFCGAAGAYLSRRAGGSPPCSRFIALDSSLRFGRLLDAHRPDCALPASMVPFRDRLAISYAAAGHGPFLGCLAVLEGNCTTGSC